MRPSPRLDPVDQARGQPGIELSALGHVSFPEKLLHGLGDFFPPRVVGKILRHP